jgi:Tfp pilus assembly protein PilN
MLPVKHSINLYLPRFQPPQLSQEVLLLIKLCLITFIGLVAISAGLWVFQVNTSGHLAELEKEQQQLNIELKTRISQFPSTSVDNNLQANLEREKKLFAKQQRVVSFLRQDSISARSSFTPLVEQLSQQSVSGIWLSKIEIINQGNDVQLSGFAQNPEKVSRYITTLGSKKAYQGRAFKHISVMQGDNSWNKFFLSTKKQNSDNLSTAQSSESRRDL